MKAGCLAWTESSQLRDSPGLDRTPITVEQAAPVFPFQSSGLGTFICIENKIKAR